jgi:hypothetical protein
MSISPGGIFGKTWGPCTRRPPTQIRNRDDGGDWQAVREPTINRWSPETPSRPGHNFRIPEAIVPTVATRLSSPAECRLCFLAENTIEAARLLFCVVSSRRYQQGGAAIRTIAKALATGLVL